MNPYLFFGNKSQSKPKDGDFVGQSLVTLKQVHGNTVHIIDNPSMTDAQLQGDALITCTSNISVGVFTADCLPVLAFGKTWIGACHAGWRGVAERIIPRFLDLILKQGERPEDIRVHVGAGIGPCHFEVGRDVCNRLLSAYNSKNTFAPETVFVSPHPNKEKVFFNLKALAKIQIQEFKIRSQQIQISEECTFCISEKFHSFRRDGAVAGRQISLIFKKT